MLLTYCSPANQLHSLPVPPTLPITVVSAGHPLINVANWPIIIISDAHSPAHLNSLGTPMITVTSAAHLPITVASAAPTKITVANTAHLPITYAHRQHHPPTTVASASHLPLIFTDLTNYLPTLPSSPTPTIAVACKAYSSITIASHALLPITVDHCWYSSQLPTPHHHWPENSEFAEHAQFRTEN